ncbi:hypothetical protein BCR41DRAFT_371277 [Lobosporangium transversale]|uniref:Uncharacterized protein n=1 Tax=Lobosporangium transversale TaxID=64571 RepID=A0A1Y2GKB4_9FUNG|nr:hypothetical protein BCR41DRAFT_371277 [Lobosporangium transversale]ORZ13756.1 hypothetical protein BCR41DRAFT_371277 [Lobosporangium transversale]|eukprot:XP_021880540.1 hypothetical protein BCR41DRAFT_371277 [Lobosporangium transversale]
MATQASKCHGAFLLSLFFFSFFLYDCIKSKFYMVVLISGSSQPCGGRWFPRVKRRVFVLKVIYKHSYNGLIIIRYKGKYNNLKCWPFFFAVTEGRDCWRDLTPHYLTVFFVVLLNQMAPITRRYHR